MDNGNSIHDSNLFINFDKPREASQVDQRANFGLSLSKSMVEKMGGKINVETQNEIGNRYSIQMIAISRIGEDKRDGFDVNA